MLNIADTHRKGDEVVDIEFQKAASAVCWWCLIFSHFTLEFDENRWVIVVCEILDAFHVSDHQQKISDSRITFSLYTSDTSYDRLSYLVGILYT